MKELDFDELDKAVNSLMTDVPKDTPPRDDVNTVTLPSDTAAPASAEPPAPSPAAPAAPASPSRPLASRRAGRFMDVVHPSTDMKKPESPAPAKPVSREGATITPTPSVETPPEPLPAATPEAPVAAPETEPSEPTPTPTPAESQPVVTPMPAPTAHQPSAASDWPDPLEMTTKNGTPVAEPEGKSEEGTESDKQPEPTPLTSPFLPDTKVEKRPLGGAAADENAMPDLPVAGMGKEDLTVGDPNAQLPASAEPSTPLPAELQGDLVAIESGAAKEAPTPPEAETPKEEDKPAEKPASEQKPRLEEKEVPTGPVSIPQQYREEPSTGDQENGAIYDTDTYHQPLAHPAQKKSGWLWVLWIVLILIIGAGTGAALYFFGII